MATDRKLYRFADGTVSTINDWCIRNAVRYEVKKDRNWYDLIDRRKYHRMGGAEQAEYEKLLKVEAAKPQYRAWTDADTFVVITKRDYLEAMKRRDATTTT